MEDAEQMYILQGSVATTELVVRGVKVENRVTSEIIASSRISVPWGSDFLLLK